MRHLPEAIEQELRPAVCERRLTDRLKTNYSIDDVTPGHVLKLLASNVTVSVNVLYSGESACYKLKPDQFKVCNASITQQNMYTKSILVGPIVDLEFVYTQTVHV